MAESQLTTAAALAALADNTDGDISPQDIRDQFTTLRNGMGQIYVPASASASITIANTNDYVEATNPVWTLSAGPYLFDESAGNGRLTYVGTVPVMAHIACTVSMTVAGTNQTTHFRLSLNGTTDVASEVQRFVSTGSDVGSTALHLVEVLTAGDYISLWARNATAANDITIEAANLQAVTSTI
jgi:hypothetical protein